MKSVDECHTIFENKTNISEGELKRCAIFIHKYTKIIFEGRNVELSNQDTHEIVSSKMYRSYLNMLIEFSQSINNKELDELFYESMDEFENDIEGTENNIYMIAGYANASAETRHNKIKQLTENLYYSNN